MAKLIDSFSGSYRFLSNFYPFEFPYANERWATAEHAYQAQKCVYRVDMLKIQRARTPGDAKRLGQKVILKDGWRTIDGGLCLQVMEEIVRAKFAGSLKSSLLATKGAELEEGNTWGDTFWGTVNGEGKNHLGIILMKVRDEMLANGEE